MGAPEMGKGGTRAVYPYFIRESTCTTHPPPIFSDIWASNKLGLNIFTHHEKYRMKLLFTVQYNQHLIIIPSQRFSPDHINNRQPTLGLQSISVSPTHAGWSQQLKR